MFINNVPIEDTFAEGFRMWATRFVVTAADEHWLDTAERTVCGYGTSVILCDAEIAVERRLAPELTPDDRPGTSILAFAFNADALGKALPRRVGQCLMTCPTVAVYDGMPAAADRLAMGRNVRFFGDGYQRSKVIAGRRLWRIPVMEGEFVCEETAGAARAVAGGNFLIQSVDVASGTRAARAAVDCIGALPDVIAPFPGGVVRSGSKVGSRYKALVASSNHEFAPTLRSRTQSKVHPDANCVLEIVVNGLSEAAISTALAAGIRSACTYPGVVGISAGNYGGSLGKFHFPLHKVLDGR